MTLKCSGFPEGKYGIRLKSSSTVSSKSQIWLHLYFDHQTGTITGGGGIFIFDQNDRPILYVQKRLKNGFHDCEHAYFEMRGSGELAAAACNVWGTGSAKIDEITATCTYVFDGQKTAVWTGKLVPDGN